MTALLNQWAIELDCSKTLLSEIANTFMISLQEIVTLLKGDEHSFHLVDVSTGHFFITTQIDKPCACNCGAVSYNEQSKARFIHLNDLGKIAAISSNLVSENSMETSSGGQMTTLNDATVVDAYPPFIYAVKAAVSLSSMILGIHNCIHDTS